MHMAWGKPQTAMLAGFVAVAYGVGAELVFQQTSDSWVGALSLSFLFLVPAALGALTVALAPADYKRSWVFAIFAPWIVCALGALVVYLLGMELWMCIVMGLPFFFAMSSLGGALVSYLYRRRDARTSGNTTLGLLVALPFVLLPLEAQLPLPTVTRTVRADVLVAADAEMVWEQLIAVPEIQPDEKRFAWFRALGLPDPVEATLNAEGVGAMRHARYANGLQVVEPVLVWEPAARYRFSVELDPASLPSPIWRAVDGPHMDVVYVEYRIDPQASGLVLLHLESVYTLATPLNGYAGVWMDFLLSDFLHYILSIVKERSELAG
jgi:hypothetical protein